VRRGFSGALFSGLAPAKLLNPLRILILDEVAVKEAESPKDEDHADEKRLLQRNAGPMGDCIAQFCGEEFEQQGRKVLPPRFRGDAMSSNLYHVSF
jgi:hypothetical protein